MAQDIALSRRKRGFDSPRERTVNYEQKSEPVSETYCSLWRRLLVIGYDLVLLFGIFFAFTLFLIPFNHGDAVESNLVYQFFLFFICSLYYCWHWVHGRETLGMRAWKVRIRDSQGKTLGWSRAVLRFCCALGSTLCLGVGFAWALFDARRRCLHDLTSNTFLLVYDDKPQITTGAE